MEYLNSLITAASTLSAVTLTLLLTNKREKNKFIQEVKYKDWQKLEQFYIDVLTIIDQQVELVKYGEYGKAKDLESSATMAKASLYATEEVVDKFREVQILIFKWAALYREKAPKRIGDSNYAVISSNSLDEELGKSANDAYDKYFNAATELAGIIQKELLLKKNKLH